MAEYYLIAKLIAIEGDKGEIKIYPISDDLKRFKKLKKVFIDFWGEKKIFSLQYVKVSKGDIFFKFENFDDYRSVEVLIGKDVFVGENDLTKLPNDHYYVHDIIGCKVLRNESDFGEVVDVYKLTSNDVFVIKKLSGEEILLPAVKDYILSVDIVKRKVILKPGDEFYEDDEN